MISCGDQRLYVVNHELERLIRGLRARQAELYGQKQQASRVRVLLVDDSPALRAGMRVAIEEAEKFSIVAETGTAIQALVLMEKTTPDIVIASLSLPDASGAVIGQKSVEQGSRSSVIFLGVADLDVCLAEAWKAGAIGFISKQVNMKQFVQFLEMASDGQYLWTTAQLKRIQEWEKNVDLFIERLSLRERDVLHLLGARMSNKEIAQKLSLSEKTVEHYVSQVLLKLGVTSRIKVAQWVEQAFGKVPCVNGGYPV